MMLSPSRLQAGLPPGGPIERQGKQRNTSPTMIANRLRALFSLISATTFKKPKATNNNDNNITH